MKKLQAILLALVLLVTNLGLSFTTHYCGGNMVASAFSIGVTSLGCDMVKEEVKNCHSHADKEYAFQTKDCCQNKYNLLQLDEDFNKRDFSLSLEINFPVAVLKVREGVPVVLTESNVSSVIYSHPPGEHNLLVWFQSFLI